MSRVLFLFKGKRNRKTHGFSDFPSLCKYLVKLRRASAGGPSLREEDPLRRGEKLRQGLPLKIVVDAVVLAPGPD